ncbi:S-layer homology domain-containing protein [Sporosarcina sp. P13]|uniref:S-layer homology domain-containing protein n=1 Tax=Sporosarcina sp. P13 TaxID=2048263 RepID=UPI0013047618|nr:S-layer homology domain-containing protein [Sporosarcina sp. P13]
MKKLARVILWTALVFVLTLVYAGSNQASAQDFKDVSKKHSNYAAIQEMKKRGFISGYPDGTFRPNENISRKHVAILLDKALKFPKPASDKLVFKDVPKSHAYYAPIMKLYNKGIISGSANGKFNPDSTVTRIQLAKMLDIAFNFNLKEFAYFNDINGSHWGFLHASALASNGVIRGDQGSFLTNKPVTRAHYAEFLYRAMKIGPTDNTDAMSKEKVLDLVNRLPYTIERIRLDGKYNKQTYNQIRSKQLPYATKYLVDGLLKDDYPYVCTECDSFLFPMLTFEPSVRFTYSQPDKNTLTVSTIEISNVITSSSFVDYVFKKEDGKWKMHDFDFRLPGKKNFEITREEAELILKLSYTQYSTPSFLKITYVSKSKATGEDYFTKEKYTFDRYKFIVETENGRETVSINSDDGTYY